MRLLSLLFVLGGFHLSSGTQAPARDAGKPPVDTASISGRVTDRESGQPLADVAVLLERRGEVRAPVTPDITRTDPNGRYVFKAMPTGDYYVAAQPSSLRATHLAQYFGDAVPINHGRTRRPSTISLQDGEARADVDIALWRSLAVNGRVVNELGEPLANVHVFVEDWQSSRRMMTGYHERSDDRGMFRIFGLPPGPYRVCADLGLFDFLGDTERIRPIRTCHPAATTDAESQPVVLASSDSGEIDIRVQFSRVFTVSGLIFDSTGSPPQGVDAYLVYLDRNGTRSTNLMVRTGGQFTARGLVPGEYALRVDTVPERPEKGAEREAAFVPLRVDSSDIEGLTVVMSKRARVRGRVVFEDDAPAPVKPINVSVVFDLATARLMGSDSPSADVNSDLTFDLPGQFGPRMLTASGPTPDYIVRSVRYEGRDITFVPTDFKDSGDTRPVEIVLTKRGARVNGRVLDEKGNPVHDAVVALLPADIARWNHRTRYGAQEVTKADATFRVGPVLPGDYFILATTPDAMPDLLSKSADAAALIEAISRRAERIRLGEGEQRAMDLRVDPLREPLLLRAHLRSY